MGLTSPKDCRSLWNAWLLRLFPFSAAPQGPHLLGFGLSELGLSLKVNSIGCVSCRL